MEKCEDCGEYKTSAFRRSETAKVQCDRCYLIALRRASRTGLVLVPKYLRGSG